MISTTISDFDLIDKILAGYQYSGSVILHPTFEDTFDDQEPDMGNRLPFHYVEKGRCTFLIYGKQYHLVEGDFIAVMRGCDYRLRNFDGEKPITTTLICGYFELMANTSQPLVDSFPEVLVIHHQDIEQSMRMKTVMQLLVAEVNSGQPGAKSAANSLSDLFFTYLMRNLINSENVEKGLMAGLSDKHLSLALAAFHHDFEGQWTLDTLAKAAGMSRTKFVEKFRQIIGITPGTYMTQWRMNWAANQLTSTDNIIYDIALSSGYQSDATFCRAFRQQFGLPPSEYRKTG